MKSGEGIAGVSPRPLKISPGLAAICSILMVVLAPVHATAARPGQSSAPTVVHPTNPARLLGSLGLSPATTPGKPTPPSDARVRAVAALIEEAIAAPASTGSGDPAGTASASSAPPATPETRSKSLNPKIDLGRWYYDARQIWGIHDEQQLQDQTYELLDRDEAELSRLAGIQVKIRSLPDSDRIARTRFNALCKQMKERVEFMDGLFRVEIGRGLATSNRSSYSFQAVQSGIDTLDRAISLRTTIEQPSAGSGAGKDLPTTRGGDPAPAMPLSEMRQIRNVIFSTWDTARAAGSPAPLAALSLSRVVGAAEATSSRDPANSAWAALRCFAWLAPPRL